MEIEQNTPPAPEAGHDCARALQLFEHESLHAGVVFYNGAIIECDCEKRWMKIMSENAAAWWYDLTPQPADPELEG